MNKLIFITGDNGFFGQTRKPWVSMDSRKMQDIIEKAGYDVENYSFHEMNNLDKPVQNSIIFYSFHQKANIRQYIKDMIAFHGNETNLIVPHLDFLLCHENKGYQELYKRKLGVKSLKAYYLNDIEQIKYYDIEYPVVLKGNEGSNGTQVFMIHSESELRDKVAKHFIKRSLKLKLDLFRRKYFRKEKSFKEYPDYSNKSDYEQYAPYITTNHNFVLQELVPDRDCDYRVSIIGDRYIVIKRMVREGDFRASGAKKFVSDFEVDKGMLEFSKDLYEKMDNPYLSLDICERDGSYYLVEYQGLHFGINSVVKTSGYYDPNNNWEWVEEKPDIERYMAEGLIKFLEKKDN